MDSGNLPLLKTSNFELGYWILEIKSTFRYIYLSAIIYVNNSPDRAL